MRARSGMRLCGPFSKSPISVRNGPLPGLGLLSLASGISCLVLSAYVLTRENNPGSRYIYDLYYEKEAISKTLYDWLLKNGYADANLISKWKKQGYEKVRLHISLFGYRVLPLLIKFFPFSYAVSAVSRPGRRISTLPAYVESQRHS